MLQLVESVADITNPLLVFEAVAPWHQVFNYVHPDCLGNEIISLQYGVSGENIVSYMFVNIGGLRFCAPCQWDIAMFWRDVLKPIFPAVGFIFPVGKVILWVPLVKYPFGA